MSDRDHQVVFKLSEQELFMLHNLAHDERMSVSGILRGWIAKNYSRKFGDKKPHPIEIRNQERRTKRKAA